MSIRRLLIVAAPLLALSLTPLLRAADAPQKHAFTFRDVGDDAGLFPHVAGIRGHAAGWGDVDGDGHIDLYVGAFYTEGSKPNQFFRNLGNGKFKLDDQKHLRLEGRPTGALFADLDNDGDLDLYVSSMSKAARPAGPKPGAVAQPALRGCALFRNDGNGKFTDVSENNPACPPAFGGRSATVLDFDGDGLLDLLVGEDPYKGYNGSTTRAARLFRNTGDLKFEDATAAAGIADVPAYGVAAADVNNDSFPDLFLACTTGGKLPGGNVLYLNDGKGKFREAPGARKAFDWPDSKEDDMVCGIAFGDVNNDGLTDALIGPHFQTQWVKPVPVRLYLNRGVDKDGTPKFEDVTTAAGLVPLPLKAPHVEIQDFDNDGRPDLYASMVKFDSAGKPHPLIYKNQGTKDGMPRFAEDVLAINDFPTDADKAIKSSGKAFEKIQTEKKITYMAPGPSGDFDNDGRLDLFLANWWMESRSLLLKNETPSGNYLDVTVTGPTGVNRMGVGARVRAYTAGKLGDPAALVGDKEIATGYGYASAQPAIAHLGLGKLDAVDLEITLPHNKGKIVMKNVKANQRIAAKQ
ncbi:MAG TPA: CRTAC1 family protein [Tepidisphaeraceae bacterium]|nr:CRTAC1 family protein [Tepidisphaeraceae bacterium]